MFSVGVVAYLMLTGKAPYPEHDEYLPTKEI
jgi:hypothetical protein